MSHIERTVIIVCSYEIVIGADIALKILHEFHASFLCIIKIIQHAHMLPVDQFIISGSKYGKIGIHYIAFQKQRCFVAVRDIHVFKMSRDKELGF